MDLETTAMRSKLDTKTNIISYFLYVESEKKKVQMNLFIKTKQAQI